MDHKEHWEIIYTEKQPNQVSWTQETPSISLQMIQSTNLPTSAKIIDVGGGESNLVDHLLLLGYNHLSVLDISQNALNRCKLRLGESGKNIEWIVSDITLFQSEIKYDIWHDRAVFHFLTEPDTISKYKSNLINALNDNGQFIIGTFSDLGPKKCSGLEIKQYTEKTLTDTFSPEFSPIEFQREDHHTPFGTVQNFVFGRFQKK
ncbi:class I SAM-dependent methyltransferase [Leptospira levettii]|uniref:Class I SAM-dependent methyltransferase n=1 Tax=Leptospira levettii TaxID=2023178 RepID=A0AAW5UVU4_9LEPT|nr:class I SAM-dependent methyltransferase [Leptospira levettii]MCW7465160.1 class I SAM-dependent methyltransferase [Leptospira levettii]MCW7496000.1 class I SAM-dependent methyltransferase [Leptospira levettii]MCW7509900.1 class I SAM-dependent methyltransferase [Leptospira levettii]MCW7513650.1 class I SAM-dependent methyltransferase [Leptospira levettii]TGL09024.1 class I SAM-dependent methyltransferase [Leptospira levettii]